MSGFWLIFRHEYRKKTARRGFLITTLSVPLMLLLVIGISILAVVDPGGNRAIGYVDYSGILASSVAGMTGSDVEIQAYSDLASAEKDLVAGRLRAFYVLAVDYLESGQLDVYYQKRAPIETMQTAFDRLLRANLVSQIAGSTPSQLVEPPEVTVQSMDGSRAIGQDGWINLILPFTASFILIFAVMMTAGSLLQVVADEKENRTIEILVTSLTPEQLIGGKAAALMAVCITQMVIWLVAAGMALGIGAQFFEPLHLISVPWELLLIIGLFIFPAYALIAALMTAVGGAAGEMRQSQQVGGLLNLLFMLPLFLSTLILQDPDSLLVVALTLFPTTSFTTVALRWSLGSVPLWQLAASWILLVASSIAAVYLAARIFRLGMLRYGKGLDLRAVVAMIFARV
jgi:ABC-2 type transport system permease protein